MILVNLVKYIQLNVIFLIRERKHTILYYQPHPNSPYYSHIHPIYILKKKIERKN